MSLDHAWMKGVPMELRPRYQPKPPLRFKDIDIYIPLDAIENDYDFTEERRVLTECKMWSDMREKEAQAEAERQLILAAAAEAEAEAERLRLEEEEKESLRLEQERFERLEREIQVQMQNQEESQSQNQNPPQLPIANLSVDQDSLMEKLAADLSLSEKCDLLEKHQESSSGSPTSEENSAQAPPLPPPHQTPAQEVPPSLPTFPPAPPPQHSQHLHLNGYHYDPYMFTPPPQQHYSYFVHTMPALQQPHQQPQPPTPQPQQQQQQPPGNHFQQFQHQQYQPFYQQPQTLQLHQNQQPPVPPHQSPALPSAVTVAPPLPPPTVPTQPQPQQQSTIVSTMTPSSGAPPPPIVSLAPTPAPPQPQPPPLDEVNSFTKLHFPFLTSMATASSAASARQNATSEDLSSQNPFLSSYVQSHQNHNHSQSSLGQYWSHSHFAATTGSPTTANVQNGVLATGNSGSGPSPPGSVNPPGASLSQHDLL